MYKIISGKFYVCRPKFYLQIDPTINQKKMKAASQVLFIHARASFISRRLQYKKSLSVILFLKGQKISLKVLFQGHLLKSFNLNMCNQIKPSSLLICNHFSRKVVLQTQIFFLIGDPEKKVGLYYKPTFFQVGEKWLTRKKI